MSSIFFLLITSCSHLVFGHISEFNPHRTHLVDIFNTSLMFRGNAPIVDGSFDREQLQQNLQMVAGNNTIKNTTLPVKFDLIVVSMLNKIKPSEAKVCVVCAWIILTECKVNFYINICKFYTILAINEQNFSPTQSLVCFVPCF